MAHHVGLFYAERIHQSDAILGEQPGGVMHIRLVAAAKAAMIVNQHLIMLGKFRHLRNTPGRQTDAGAGNQHERIAFTIEFIIQIDVVNFDFAAFDRFKLFQDLLQKFPDYGKETMPCTTGDATESKI